jgi:hypothetical protein
MSKAMSNNPNFRILNMIIYAICAAILSGCGKTSISPKVDLSGCYYDGSELVMKIEKGSVIVNGKVMASAQVGQGQSGSYIKFKPALHIKKTLGVNKIVIFNEMKSNYLTTIMELGKINILMPSETLGQDKLIRESCSS